MINKQCKECNKEFTPKRKDQSYCSQQCSVKHNKKNSNFGTIPGLKRKKQELTYIDTLIIEE